MKSIKRATGSSGLIDDYHIGDARQIARIFPAEPLVATTVTSPPYWNLKDYGSTKQVGYGQDYLVYLADLKQIFTDIYRNSL